MAWRRRKAYLQPSRCKIQSDLVLQHEHPAQPNGDPLFRRNERALAGIGFLDPLLCRASKTLR